MKKSRLFRLSALLTAFSMTYPMAPAQAATHTAKVENKDGQYYVVGSTYSAILPPTGLLTLLKQENASTFIDRPITICIGNEWNPNSRQTAFSSITQPEANVLVCHGSVGTLRYQFDADSIILSLTAKTDRLRAFITLSDAVESVWTDGKFLGASLHPAGGKTGDFFLHSVKVLSSNNVLDISNMTVFYGPNILRLDAEKGSTATSTWRIAPMTAADKSSFATESLYTAPIAILSPKDYQVFQRQTLGSGRVTISGRASVPCDTLEFRIGDGAWQSVNINPVTGNFFAQINATAAPHWYPCELRAMKNGKEIAAKTIEHVGIGEVFVAAGQSNSTNNGHIPLRTASGMVSAFDGIRWQLGNDPLPGAYDLSRGGSFYPELGDLLFERFHVPIAFASTGMGGSNVTTWAPGGDLFRWMQTRIEQLGPQGFRAVLWHQGEADGSTPEQEYYDRLKAIIEQSNVQAGWSFPWMVAQVGGKNTRNAKVNLWADGVALEGPDSDTLKGAENRYQNGAHFTEIGLRRHAALWFENLADYLDKAVPTTTAPATANIR